MIVRSPARNTGGLRRGIAPAAFWSLPFLIAALAGCGGGVDETIITVAEGADSHQLWSPDRPGLDMTPENQDTWMVTLPMGAGGEGAPVIRIEANPAGDLIHNRFWIGERSGGVEVPVVPYTGYPGYYEVDPVSVTLSTGGAGAEGSAREVRIAPLIRARGDSAIQFRYSAADVMRGYFPAVGREFLLYDGNGNGLYEMNDLLVIDQNGDGLFDGNRNSVERYAVGEPFLLGDHAYRIASVTTDGSKVRWIDSDVRPEVRIPLLTGDPAPDFELPDLQGKAVRFSEVSRGRPVLLSYWATW